jgi:hypothetical protein
MLSHLEDIEVAINTFSAANGGFGKTHLMHASKVVAGVQVTHPHREKERHRQHARAREREREIERGREGEGLRARAKQRAGERARDFIRNSR